MIDHDLATDRFLRAVENSVNTQIHRQCEQLGESLRDLLYDLLNYPPERSRRDSLAIFADHWSARGLRLTPRTVRSIEQLIEDERGVRGAELGWGIGAEDRRADAPAVLLAAAPRGRGRSGKGSRGNSGGRRRQAAKPPAGIDSRNYPRGEWVTGVEGNGLRKLEKPITIGKTGEVVTHIEFRNGFPVLDKWALPNQDVTIAITGNPDFDRIEARKAWKHTHGDVPQKVVFHHDGNFTELGKHKNHRIMAGRMQMLPGEFHRVLKHKGSASLARFHYLNEKVAREVNELARKGKGPLVALQRRLAQRVTRSLRIGRVVPIVGGLITLYFFAEDVEAHGLGGAVVRATPLLGDIVSAADLGRELAAEIRAAARRRIKDAEDRANLPVKAAQRDAAEATSAAFIEIARTLPVTKEYMRLEEIEQAVRDAIRGFTARSTQCIFTFIREPMEALRQSTSRGDFGPRDTRWSRSYNRGYRSPQNWIGRAL